MNGPHPEVAMSGPMPAELEAKAQERTARITARSADAFLGTPRHRLSPAVERLATLCGAVAGGSEQGTERLKETAGVRPGE